MSVPERGGYPAGGQTVSDLPSPAGDLRWVSVGLRFPLRSPQPGYSLLLGAKTVVYDAKSGALLPARILRVDAPPDGAVTVDVRLEVAEVTVECSET